MIRALFSFLMAAMIVLPTAPAGAARVTPMLVEVEPVGRASSTRVELSNPETGEFPVEVLMFRGIISENGELALEPADADFVVFPSQARIAPQSQQVIRLQYVGDPTLSRSEIYYMSIREIPVEFTPGQSELQLLINFNVLVNVVPDGTAAVPRVDTITPVSEEAFEGVEVRVANDGSRYFAAGLRDWVFQGRAADGSAKTARIPAAQMANIVGVGVVPPGGARLFRIPATAVPVSEAALIALQD